jgi:hypothetical protein
LAARQEDGQRLIDLIPIPDLHSTSFFTAASFADEEKRHMHMGTIHWFYAPKPRWLSTS